MRRLWFALLVLVALTAACGGGEPADTATPGAAGGSPARSPAAVRKASPTPASTTPTPGGTVTPTATSIPTGTPSSQQAADAALAAALKQFDGVRDADCRAVNPGKKPCLSPRSNPAAVQRGIAVFGVSDPDGGGGFIAVLGRDPTGGWKLWFTTQNAYQLLFLPGDMRACAEGQGLNVRSAPTTNASVVATLKDLTIVRGEEFALTGPASDPLKPGYGWYRLSAPENGWAYSKFLANAALGDCSTRDAQEGR